MYNGALDIVESYVLIWRCSGKNCLGKKATFSSKFNRIDHFANVLFVIDANRIPE